MNDRLPLSLKRKGYNQCVLPVLIYWGRNIWGLTMHLERKHRSAQEAMERRMTAECLETGNDLGSDHYKYKVHWNRERKIGEIKSKEFDMINRGTAQGSSVLG